MIHTKLPQALASMGRLHLRQVVITLALTFVAALPREAPAAEDPGLRSYRCTVLGDTTACPPAKPEPASSIVERIEPGPYARYLMVVRGLNRDAALAEAAGIGEYPVHRVVSVTTRKLTDFERYERWVGRPVAPERTEVTLSATILAPQSSAVARAVKGH